MALQAKIFLESRNKALAEELDTLITEHRVFGAERRRWQRNHMAQQNALDALDSIIADATDHAIDFK